MTLNRSILGNLITDLITDLIVSSAPAQDAFYNSSGNVFVFSNGDLWEFSS